MTNIQSTALTRFLARLQSRSVLGEAERAAILDLPSVATEVAVRHNFVRLGDKIDHACLIVDGLCARFGQTLDGDRQIVALHIPGDMADLHSLVAPNVCWALQALSPSTILQIPHEALNALVDHYPAIGGALWRDTMVDASILAQWMLNYARKSALANVAHLLCEMHVRYDRIGLAAAGSFTLPITQIQIGDALGLTSVHVNRMLKQLQKDGIAEKRSHAVMIADLERLVQVAEFDPIYLQIPEVPVG